MKRVLQQQLSTSQDMQHRPIIASIGLQGQVLLRWSGQAYPTYSPVMAFLNSTLYVLELIL